MLKRAKASVLFIDEAYDLYRAENERDYRQEAIEILLPVMETEPEDLVVILASYKDRMETFFRSNRQGSRVADHLHFADLTPEELVQIADLMMEKQQYQFEPEAREAFLEYINRRLERPRFRIRAQHPQRDRSRAHASGRPAVRHRDNLSKEDLMTIKAEDILADSLFGDEEGESPEDEKADSNGARRRTPAVTRASFQETPCPSDYPWCRPIPRLARRRCCSSAPAALVGSRRLLQARQPRRSGSSRRRSSCARASYIRI